ncbi:MAG: tail fiber domain-containing protein [Bacteroidota bacterium]
MKKLITLIAALYSLAASICTADAQSWSLTGNTGTNSSTNFIGTKDNVNFKIRTKNNVRMTITSGGKIAIGNGLPAFKLDVQGGSINTDSVYRIGGNTILSVKGASNTFVGINSGDSITTGLFNTAIGKSTLSNSTAAFNNTACGYEALYTNQTGNSNSANGTVSLFSNVSGSRNTANGNAALYSNINGIENTASGNSALFSNTSGNNNTAIGNSALYYNISGSNNTAIGNTSLDFNSLGSNNTANGYNALFSHRTGDNNTASGSGSLQADTSGTFNSAYGAQSLIQNRNGISNTSVGYQSMFSNRTGNYNTVCGTAALYNNTSGSSNAAFGYFALVNTTTAQYNTAVGYAAGDAFNNGFNNIFLGASVDVNAAGLFNVIAVGQGTIVTSGSSTARFGNAATGSYGDYADWTNISDGRYKKNIKENVPGLEFINKLRPVTYNLDARGLDVFLHKNNKEELSAEAKSVHEKALAEKAKIINTGFIAQEVEAAAKELGYDFSGVDAAKNENDVYGLRYAEFVVPLVKAVQELNEKLKSDVRSLKSENEKQNQRIEKLEAMLSSNRNSSSLNNSIASSPSLQQNQPNPFNEKSEITFSVGENAVSAWLILRDLQGKELKKINVNGAREQRLNFNAKEFSAGAYTYSLEIDGKTIDTKLMMVTH